MGAFGWFIAGMVATIIVSVGIVIYIYRDAFGGDEDADTAKLKNMGHIRSTVREIADKKESKSKG